MCQKAPLKTHWCGFRPKEGGSNHSENPGTMFFVILTIVLTTTNRVWIVLESHGFFQSRNISRNPGTILETYQLNLPFWSQERILVVFTASSPHSVYRQYKHSLMVCTGLPPAKDSLCQLVPVVQVISWLVNIHTVQHHTSLWAWICSYNRLDHIGYIKWLTNTVSSHQWWHSEPVRKVLRAPNHH